MKMSLKELDLSYNSRISDKAIKNITSLVKLILSSSTFISEEGIKNLTTSNILMLIAILTTNVSRSSNLEHLSLKVDNYDDMSIIADNGIKNMTSLTWLHLDRSEVTTDGL
jgi:hypothetical protein